MEFFEDLRPCDISLSTVFKEMRSIFPQIEKNEVEFFYHGTYNVFEVKNCYIFRIPDMTLRNQKGVDLILKEVKMLDHIREYVSVKIPEPIYISTDEFCPYMGYKKIEGIPLHKAFNKITTEKRLKIAADIGNFLTELHSEKLYKDAINSKIITNTFSCERYKGILSHYFKDVQQSLFPLLNEKQKKWISMLFINFLDNEANFKFTYSIIHGDFDTSNILIDPHDFNVLGIVDFEESRAYDRAADFLFYDEGNKFLQKVLTSYNLSIDENFVERMTFLFKCSCLGYLSYGVNNNLPDLINMGFKLLKKRMKRFPQFN